MHTKQLPHTIIYPFPIFVRYRKANKEYFAIVTAAKKKKNDPYVLDYVFVGNKIITREVIGIN